MFTRVSRRTLACDGRRQSLLYSDVLQLPFLCPALYGPRLVPKAKVTTTSRGDLARSPTGTPLNAKPADKVTIPRHTRQQRGLASAVAAHELLQDEFIPFEGVHGPPLQQQRQQQQPGVSLYPFGSDAYASPLVLKMSDVPSGRFRSVDAISGDLNEIHQTLHACLQVGRFERARALIRRLALIYKPDAPGLITAHNDYIREVTLRLIEEQNPSLMKDLQMWFEVEIRKGRIPPDARTYALMIQASSWGVDPNAKDRSIRRYIRLAREFGIEEETLRLAAELDGVAEMTVQQVNADTFTEHPPPNENSLDAGESVTQQTALTIKPEAQKGFGLATLQAQLSVLQDRPPTDEKSSDFLRSVDGTSSTSSPYAKQLALERNTVDAAVERWRKEDAQLRSQGLLNVLSTRSVNAIMWQWHTVLEPALKEELQKASEAETKDAKVRTKADEARLLWAPYLLDIPTEKLSVSSIISCLRTVCLQSNDDRGAKVVTLVSSISSAIEQERLVKYTKTSKKYRQWRALTQEDSKRKREHTAKPTTEHSPEATSDATSNSLSQDIQKFEWPPSVRVRIGAMLLSQILENTKIEVSRKGRSGDTVREKQNAFSHSYSYIAGKRVGVIRLNPALMEIMTKAPLSPSLAKQLPMVHPPQPWTGYVDGGYLEQPLSVVRLDPSDILAKRYAMTASSNGDMTQIFAGLDVLGKTPWKINRRVLEVMAEAWNSGEAVAKIPPENPEIEIAPEPLPSASLKERMKWLRSVKEAENYKSGVKSQRCFLNFQLEVAKAFLDETLYYPHNIDFRGRAYPMAPFLNHMGADNARGLLQFAEKKILGPVGLQWLKVHLANVYGFDKANFQERQKFTEDHMPDIIDAANNGIHGKRWWLGAEDPWQCLAACIDLKDALDLPDPTKHCSQLAVHQDGTCNGLQHYAALGGDVDGAKQVNLEPGDRPSDIYTAVAEMVKKEITKEAADGDELAKRLDGKLTRKVVKQTVMTNVYGVTFVGAQRQVRKQLQLLLPDFPETDGIHIVMAATYIARKIFRSLATMFNRAHDIQHWLGDCAGRICSSISPEQVEAIEQGGTGQAVSSQFSRKPIPTQANSQLFTTGVIWTTPLKLPVVQSYSKGARVKIATDVQLITTVDPNQVTPVDKAKQLQAFAPNFIHSLDGTHMFLTALRCDEAGLTFAAVHDSFWTHAGDIDTMNSITREAFIRMHSENIIERLRAEFETRYKNHMCLTAAAYSSVVGIRIRAWRKAHGFPNFGASSVKKYTAELLMEVKRLKLLASENPAERAEGAAMVTPGSIYEQSRADERTLGVPLDTAAPPLGEVSTQGMNLKANEELVGVGNMENAGPSPKRLGSNKTFLWVPLTFPPVPKKGDFDVNRLRDSKYFFS